jgi:erythromycin esterase
MSLPTRPRRAVLAAALITGAVATAAVVQAPPGAAAPAPPDWVAAAVPVAGALGDDPAELSALDVVVGDARVLLAGEATHGTGEFFTDKADIAAALVAERGFTDVLLEEPVASSAAAARYVATGEGSAQAAAEEFSFDIWRTEEFVRMLELLRAHNATADQPVFFLGMDVQGVPAETIALIEAHLARTEPRDARRVGEQLRCFALTAAETATWAARPERERSRCRDSLERVRDRFRAEARERAGEPRDVEFHLAHAAAVSLPETERSLAVDIGDGTDAAAFSDTLSLRDEGMAQVVLSALERDEDARVLVSAHNVHAGELRDVPARLSDTATAVLRASTGALLTERLGDDAVRSLGFSFGNGQFNALDAAGGQPGPVPFTAEPPVPGSYEEELERSAPAASFVLPLREGVDSLVAPRPLRTLTAGSYDPARPQDSYATASLPGTFDGLVHHRTTTPSALRAVEPSLRVDGEPVPVRSSCFVDAEGSVRAEVDGGRLTLALGPDGTSATATLDRGGRTATSDLALTFRAGVWRGAGSLTGADGTAVEIALTLPVPGSCPA